MIGRAFLLATILALSACAGDEAVAPDIADPPVSNATEVDAAVEALVSVCLANGLSRESCTCSAQASAKVLDERDFLTHSELQLRRDQAGIDEFLRRKYAEDPNTMHKLGQALTQCPGSFVPAEVNH